MGSIRAAVSRALNGTYTLSISTGGSPQGGVWDVLSGFWGSIDEDMRVVCEHIRTDKALKRGYVALGFSQGGQMLRGVLERCGGVVGVEGWSGVEAEGGKGRAVGRAGAPLNAPSLSMAPLLRPVHPPAHTLVTMGAQHQGVMALPGCWEPGENRTLTGWCAISQAAVGLFVYRSLIQRVSIQAQYTKDPYRLPGYYCQSAYLRDVNNERARCAEPWRQIWGERAKASRDGREARRTLAAGATGYAQAFEDDTPAALPSGALTANLSEAPALAAGAVPPSVAPRVPYPLLPPTAEYAANLASLRRLVLYQFDSDVTVVPRQSAHFGWFDGTQLRSMEETPLYRRDRIGLRTLHRLGRLERISVPGFHLQFTVAWFVEVVLFPHLAVKVDEAWKEPGEGGSEKVHADAPKEGWPTLNATLEEAKTAYPPDEVPWWVTELEARKRDTPTWERAVDAAEQSEAVRSTALLQQA